MDWHKDDLIVKCEEEKYPTIRIIKLKNPYNEIIIINIIDITGVIIKVEKCDIMQGLNSITFDKKDLKPGIYFVKINTEKENITKRIIIK